IAAARLLQLARHREREPRARAAERMADGDRAAVRIDARILQVDLHELEAAEHLAGEGLVDLYDIHFFEFKTGALERPGNRISGPHAHDARLDPGARSGKDARDRLFALLLSPFLRRDHERRGAVVNARSIPRGHDAALE